MFCFCDVVLLEGEAFCTEELLECAVVLGTRSIEEQANSKSFCARYWVDAGRMAEAGSGV